MNRTERNPWGLVLTGPAFLYYLCIVIKVITTPLPPHLAEAGHLQLLTNWALVLVVVSLGISCFSYITRLKLLWKISQEIHPVALGLCSTVSFVYWPLRILMLDRMVADVNQLNVSVIFDILLHLLPTLVLILEYYLFMPAWRLTWIGALVWSITVAYAYWWVLHRVIDTDLGMRFPYVFLEVPTHFRAIIFLVIGSAGFITTLIHGAMHRLLIKPVLVKAKKN